MPGNIRVALAVVVAKCRSRGVPVVSRDRRHRCQRRMGIVNLRNNQHAPNAIQLLTVRETAEFLRQSEWSIRQKIGRGEIPALRIGVGPKAPLRVDAAELEQWLLRLSSPKSPASEAAPLGVGALARARAIPDLPRTG